MNVYESVCIISPSQTDEEIEKLTEKIREIIGRAGAAVLKIANEGKKKLAYEIGHERRGTYLIVQFRGKGTVVSELERFHRMEDAVMKFLTVKVAPEQAVDEAPAESGGEAPAEAATA